MIDLLLFWTVYDGQFEVPFELAPQVNFVYLCRFVRLDFQILLNRRSEIKFPYTLDGVEDRENFYLAPVCGKLLDTVDRRCQSYYTRYGFWERLTGKNLSLSAQKTLFSIRHFLSVPFSRDQ